ncbi:MAG: hypothetical protein NUV91_10370, partial [Candidatus Omnitrophica bacterium]|nr:hypothetical protein [Candidatus Omnitrophota bacterium]
LWGVILRDHIPEESETDPRESALREAESDLALKFLGHLTLPEVVQLKLLRQAIRESPEYRRGMSRVRGNIEIFFVPTEGSRELFWIGEESAATQLDKRTRRLYISLPLALSEQLAIIGQEPLILALAHEELAGEYEDSSRILEAISRRDRVRSSGGSDSASATWAYVSRRRVETPGIDQPGAYILPTEDGYLEPRDLETFWRDVRSAMATTRDQFTVSVGVKPQGLSVHRRDLRARPASQTFLLPTGWGNTFGLSEDRLADILSHALNHLVENEGLSSPSFTDRQPLAVLPVFHFLDEEGFDHLAGDHVENRIIFLHAVIPAVVRRLNQDIDGLGDVLLQVLIEHELFHELSGKGRDIEAYLTTRDIERMIALLREREIPLYESFAALVQREIVPQFLLGRVLIHNEQIGLGQNGRRVLESLHDGKLEEGARLMVAAFRRSAPQSMVEEIDEEQLFAELAGVFLAMNSLGNFWQETPVEDRSRSMLHWLASGYAYLGDPLEGLRAVIQVADQLREGAVFQVGNRLAGGQEVSLDILRSEDQSMARLDFATLFQKFIQQLREERDRQREGLAASRLARRETAAVDDSSRAEEALRAHVETQFDRMREPYQNGIGQYIRHSGDREVRAVIPRRGEQWAFSEREADVALYLMGAITEPELDELTQVRRDLFSLPEYREAYRQISRGQPQPFPRIEIFFVPTTAGTQFFWVGGNYAPIHFDRERGRLYIPLPLALAEARLRLASSSARTDGGQDADQGFPILLDLARPELSGTKYSPAVFARIQPIKEQDQRQRARYYFSDERHREEFNNPIEQVLREIVGELKRKGIDVPMQTLWRTGMEKMVDQYDFREVIRQRGEGGVLTLPSGGQMYYVGNVLVIIDPRFAGLEHAGRGTYQLGVFAATQLKALHELIELIRLTQLAREHGILRGTSPEDAIWDPDDWLGIRMKEYANGIGTHAIARRKNRRDELLKRQILVRKIWIQAHQAAMAAEFQDDLAAQGEREAAIRRRIDMVEQEVPEIIEPILDGSFDIATAGNGGIDDGESVPQKARRRIREILEGSYLYLSERLHPHQIDGITQRVQEHLAEQFHLTDQQIIQLDHLEDRVRLRWLSANEFAVNDLDGNPLITASRVEAGRLAIMDEDLGLGRDKGKVFLARLERGEIFRQQNDIIQRVSGITATETEYEYEEEKFFPVVADALLSLDVLRPNERGNRDAHVTSNRYFILLAAMAYGQNSSHRSALHGLQMVDAIKRAISAEGGIPEGILIGTTAYAHIDLKLIRAMSFDLFTGVMMRDLIPRFYKRTEAQGKAQDLRRERDIQAANHYRLTPAQEEPAISLFRKFEELRRIYNENATDELRWEYRKGSSTRLRSPIPSLGIESPLTENEADIALMAAGILPENEFFGLDFLRAVIKDSDEFRRADESLGEEKQIRIFFMPTLNDDRL